jgi:hypothetical protein
VTETGDTLSDISAADLSCQSCSDQGSVSELQFLPGSYWEFYGFFFFLISKTIAEEIRNIGEKTVIL